jgi:hypothetical protein
MNSGDMTEKDRVYEKLALSIELYFKIPEDDQRVICDSIIRKCCQKVLQLHTTVPPVKKASDTIR